MLKLPRYNEKTHEFDWNDLYIPDYFENPDILLPEVEKEEREFEEQKKKDEEERLRRIKEEEEDEEEYKRMSSQKD